MAQPGVIANGNIAYVRYDGFEVWHEIMICGFIQNDEYLTVAPDFEFFVEQLSANNLDLDGFRVQPPGGVLPLGIDAESVYGFRPLNRAERAQVLAEGLQLAEGERLGRGLGGPGAGGGLPAAAAAQALAPLAVAAGPQPPPAGMLPIAAGAPAPAAAVPAAAVPVVLAGAAGVWIADEPGENVDVGDEFQLPGGAVIMGDRALVSVNQEVMVLKRLPAGANISEYAKERRAFLADDVRVIPQRLDRPHTFEEAVRNMTRAVIPRTFASPISGPDTAEWFIEATISQGHGGLISRHHRWKRDSGVGQKDRIVYEHEVIARAVEYLGTIDGVNLKTSVGVEFLLRRKQLLEEAVGENPEAPSYEGANHYMGSAERPGGALLDPRLRAHVANEMSREAAVLKEKRKAREVRGDGHGNKNKGKGKGNQGTGGGGTTTSTNP